MQKGLAGFGLGTMTLASVGVALHALRYTLVPWNIWLGVDAGIRGVIEHVPLQMLMHAIVAPVALLVGPFQFISWIRIHRPRLHRWMGRLYVAACIVAGTAALATAPFASGGRIAGLGFATLAILWVSTTIAAWRAAVLRKFALHRLLMRFSYAMTFAAVTLRLQIPLGFLFFGFASYSQMSVWLAYTCWIPNVIAVAFYSIGIALRERPVPVGV